MAPNQNQKNFSSALLLNHDEVLVRPKQFPSLTGSNDIPVVNSDPVSSLKKETGAVPSVIKQIQPSCDSAKYSTEPATSSISSSTEDLFSASFVEACLLAESQRLASGPVKGVVIIRAEQRPNDGYWDEAASFVIKSQSNQATADETGYWDWQSQEQDDVETPLESLIVQNELDFHEASTRRTAERLLEDASRRLMNGCLATAGTKAEYDDYWSWESPSIVRADPATISESYWEWNDKRALEASCVIASIPECETKRELFSIEHIVQTETTRTCAQQKQQLVSTAAREELDNYWVWNTEATVESDVIWRQGLSVPTKGYWDW